ncbi:tyrosine-type recombinase/integrase [Streptomyces sp. NPDC044948]|uniref:tyrosine-type recombinase/integrase n=2 Tax=Streptomyces TaxID=1883 RepID=UPI0033C3C1A6
MNTSRLALPTENGPERWSWPIIPDHYDTAVEVRPAEAVAVSELGVRNLRRLKDHDPSAAGWRVIHRLMVPLEAVNAALDSPPTPHRRRAMLDVIALLLTRCAETGRTFWGWTSEEWIHLLGRNQTEFHEHAPGWVNDEVRPYLAAHAYLLGSFNEFHRLGSFQRLTLSWRVFGRGLVTSEIARIRAVLASWGYQLGRDDDTLLPMVVCQLLLLNRSPHLEDLDTSLFERVRREKMLAGSQRYTLHATQRAVAELGFCDPPQPITGRQSARATGGAKTWEQWVDRWHATSTLTPGVRGAMRSALLRVGRWIAAEQPDTADPTFWTRQTCATWIAAVDRMRVGDYVQRTAGLGDRIGKPLEAATKAAQITALRTFFRDCQEWEWLPRGFDPLRALAIPRSITALLGPDPRVIADEVWAKLLWAGLNLEAADLPQSQAGQFYPFELVRAVTLTWLFSGQRSNEIARLRVGCIRWQHEGTPITGDSQEVLARDTVCLLDVPPHKTGTAFTKPVDPILGQAVDAWQAARPDQPKFTDRRTGERVDLLFAIRARRVSTHYINNTIIPMLCRKAGVPDADVRGNITSHRARSTIASQLYNAKEPMTLFELQAWLGHRSPQSTQYYAKITPNTLSKAYSEAGYFERNVRTIEVLVDRDAVASGAAATGEPWQHYDLGHGYCSYTFFEQCQHRMACARCDFYSPKESTRSQLLEAKSNLQRMAVSIPLTDDEQAAVEDGQAALDRLLDRLADTPTPAGPTPRDLDLPATARLLPLVDVRQGGAGTAPR